MNAYAAALAAIEAAALTPAMHVLATKLLARVHPDNGYITMTWDDALALCGVKSKNTVWKYLGRLKAAGLIHYSTNEQVDIAFEVWRRNPPAECPRAASGRCTRLHDEPETLDLDAEIRQRSAHAPLAEGARADPEGIGIGIGKVGIDQDPLHEELNTIPTLPEPARAERDRTLALLTDPALQVSEETARRLAARHPFGAVLRHAFAYLAHLKEGKVSDAGALVHRLDNSKQFPPGELTESDRASPLYRRHVDAAEERRRERERWVPAEYAGVINH